MTQDKVDMFLATNGKYFEATQMNVIRERLLKLDDSKWSMIQMIQYKDPTTMLIVSLLGGCIGLDRFMIGDTGLGVGKLLTCGGFYIWAIIDLFLIMGATKEKNMQKLQQFLF